MMISLGEKHPEREPAPRHRPERAIGDAILTSCRRKAKSLLRFRMLTVFASF